VSAVPRLLIKVLDAAIDPPSYAREGDAGLDLRSALDVCVPPGHRHTVPTGVAIAVPTGYVGFVVPRSGLAARNGLGIVNAPGTIDSGYRGEIKVIVINHDSDHDIHLARGDRIAQLVVVPVSAVIVETVKDLPESQRGTEGLGSTGGIAQWDTSLRKER
jgi:dUTP pyrophosphatase